MEYPGALAASGFFLVYLLYSNIQDHSPISTKKPHTLSPPELCSLPFHLLSFFLSYYTPDYTIYFQQSGICVAGRRVFLLVQLDILTIFNFLLDNSIRLLASGPVPLTRSTRVSVSFRLDPNLLVVQPI